MSGEDGNSGMELQIGQTLEQAREEQGLSLREVEHATKIRARYLAELEKENFDVLPSVYVRGSLKTYANYLQLDTEALIRELDDRWAAQHEEQAPPYGEPPESDFDRPPIYTASLAGAESSQTNEDEEDTRPMLLLAVNNYRLYLGAGATLVLILAAAVLALSYTSDDSQPTISQLREPMSSRITLASGGEEEEARRPDEAAEDERAARTEQQEQGDPDQAQNPGDATISPPASPTIGTIPAATEPNVAPVSPPTPATPGPVPPAPPVARVPAQDNTPDFSPGGPKNPVLKPSWRQRVRDQADRAGRRQLDRALQQRGWPY